MGEVLIAIAVVAIIGTSLAVLLMVAQRNQESARRRDIAASLANEAFVAVRAIVDSDDATSQGYNKIYCPPDTDQPNGGDCATPGPKGTSAHYNVEISAGSWVLTRGSDAGGSDQQILLAGLTFTRYLTIENVSRDASGDIVTSGGTDDPATQKITVTVSVPQTSNLVISEYLTRWRNVASTQTDWKTEDTTTTSVDAFGDAYSEKGANVESAAEPGQITLASGANGTLTSMTFDTKAVNGAGYNTILWQGTNGTGRVQFKIATAEAEGGPWTYRNPSACGTGWETIEPNTATAFNLACWNNMRYFRYRARLCSNDCVTSGAISPTVTDITVNWAK